MFDTVRGERDHYQWCADLQRLPPHPACRHFMFSHRERCFHSSEMDAFVSAALLMCRTEVALSRDVGGISTQ